MTTSSPVEKRARRKAETRTGSAPVEAAAGTAASGPAQAVAPEKTFAPVLPVPDAAPAAARPAPDLSALIDVVKKTPRPAPAVAPSGLRAAARRHAPLAACVALALVVGGGAATALRPAQPGVSPETVAAIARDQAIATKALHETVDRLSIRVEAMASAVQRPREVPEVRALKASVEKLESGLDKSRNDLAAAVAPLVGRFEHMDRQQREAAQRLAQIADRLEKLEKQGATGSIAPSPAAPAPAPAPAKAADADPVVKGWSLVEVSRGVALLENGRNGLFEVEKGASVPGLGRIQSIERRGTGWVVVTSQGVVTAR